MTHRLAISILLSVAVIVAFVCAVGVLAMRNAYQRVHYLGPVASISSVCVTAGVLVAEGLNQASIKALFVTGLLLLMNAVLSHATVRAARIREFGAWEPRPGERVLRERDEEQRS